MEPELRVLDYTPPEKFYYDKDFNKIIVRSTSPEITNNLLNAISQNIQFYIGFTSTKTWVIDDIRIDKTIETSDGILDIVLKYIQTRTDYSDIAFYGIYSI